MATRTAVSIDGDAQQSMFKRTLKIAAVALAALALACAVLAIASYFELSQAEELRSTEHADVEQGTIKVPSTWQ